MWGSGVAHVIDVPAPWIENVTAVDDRLRAFGSEHLVAFGALPFDGRRAAAFVIPEVLWVHDADGERVRIHATATTRPGSPPERIEGPPRPPTEFSLRSVVDPMTWCEGVLAARERIRSGDLTKVVLAREIEVTADEPIDPATLWNRLREGHPDSFCFSVDGFVGASPELLVSRHGATVRARPMAGTTPRTGHQDLDAQRAAELLASSKNLSEHQVTIDAVHDALLGWCSFLDAEPSPSVVPAGSVQHLATMVEGRLSRPEPTVLELVAALHPTPAVGGYPTDAALALQGELEPASRGRYAGPVGWVDSTGNGTFAVGIRSIQLDGRRGRLFTGVGVVADSEPEAELAETRAKSQAVLSALVRI